MAKRTRKLHVQPAKAGQCLCGCGQDPSSPKRQFRIGHDARLKSYGRKIEAGEMSRSSASDAAAEWLAGHGIRVRPRRTG